MFFLFVSSLILQEYTTIGEKKFTLKPGKYAITCYGGQGGQSYKDDAIQTNGGYGAYVYGTIIIKGSGTTFFAEVGGQSKSTSSSGPNPGGYNGGGSSGKDDDNDASGGGGGATDLRIYDNSIKSRIMVAAGGSGGVWDLIGSPGGDMYGYEYYANDDNSIMISNKASQTNGDLYGFGGNGENNNKIPGSGGGGKQEKQDQVKKVGKLLESVVLLTYQASQHARWI